MTKQLTVLALTFLVLSTMPPTVSAGATTCTSYGFTNDYIGNHYSFISNNSILVGNDLTYISDCPFSIKIGQSVISTNSQPNDHYSITTTIPINTESFSITVDNNTYSYENLTIYPAGEASYTIVIPEDDNVASNQELFTSELLAHGITFLILFFMSTNVVYRIARRNVDNAIEVII